MLPLIFFKMFAFQFSDIFSTYLCIAANMVFFANICHRLIDEARDITIN